MNFVELIFAPTSLSSPNHPLALQSLCRLVRFSLAQSDFMSGWGPAAYSLHVAPPPRQCTEPKKLSFLEALWLVQQWKGEKNSKELENKQVKRVMAN